MSVLVKPEEEIAVALGQYFDVAGVRLE